MNHWQNFYHDATAEQLDKASQIIAAAKPHGWEPWEVDKIVLALEK